MKKLLFIFLMLAVLTGCHGLRMGVGLKGEFIDEDTLVLDGDTFTIQERIGDSLFIIWNYEHSDEKYATGTGQRHQGFCFPKTVIL